MSSVPPPRADQRLDRRRRRPGGWTASSSAREAAGDSRTSQPSQSRRRARARSRRSARRARDGRRCRARARRGGGTGRGHGAGTVPRDGAAPRRRLELTSSSSAPGPPGLYAALTAARQGARVALVSATPLAQTASYWAQGGIAAALAVDDSPDAHLDDTERAGRGLVRADAAARCSCDEAPRAVARPRAPRRALRRRPPRQPRARPRGRPLHAARRPRRRQRDRPARRAPALGRRRRGTSASRSSRARAPPPVDARRTAAPASSARTAARSPRAATILATGGAAALWSRTTNPPGSLGIGLVLAHEAGAALADLEFLQFHPTAVTGDPGREGFLVTEAIRGEGATLHDARRRALRRRARAARRGRARDLVADADGAAASVPRHAPRRPARFPERRHGAARRGPRPDARARPGRPAAHYMMGGIVTDLDGATAVPGLYAVGESACTGLHGANRLASNSLSECFVFGARAARAALDEPAPAPGRPPPPAILPAPAAATREALWRDAGLVRTRASLERLRDDPHPLARLVAACALLRAESRGAHRRRTSPTATPRSTATTPSRRPAPRRPSSSAGPERRGA